MLFKYSLPDDAEIGRSLRANNDADGPAHPLNFRFYFPGACLIGLFLVKKNVTELCAFRVPSLSQGFHRQECRSAGISQSTAPKLHDTN
jgi:hypothetical protein